MSATPTVVLRMSMVCQTLVIVRPDGFVAWRAKDGRHASAVTMSAVLRSLLCRDEQAQASIRGLTNSMQSPHLA
jgi:hypothetical protein